MFGHIVRSGLVLVGLGVAGASAAPSAAVPLSIQCHATGTKFFAPALMDADVCARFVRTLGVAARSSAWLRIDPPRDGLVVELRFLPRGMASAKVTQIRAGRAKPLPVYELAISDRQFMASDIDILAGDVARGLTAGMPGKGRG